MAESFFATLGRSAQEAVEDCIENYYNLQRKHSHIDDATPLEYELKAQIQELETVHENGTASPLRQMKAGTPDVGDT